MIWDKAERFACASATRASSRASRAAMGARANGQPRTARWCHGNSPPRGGVAAGTEARRICMDRAGRGGSRARSASATCTCRDLGLWPQDKQHHSSPTGALSLRFCGRPPVR